MQIELLSLSNAAVKASTNYDGSQRIVESHGRYQDAVNRGNCYTVGDTAGRTIPAGLSTAPITVSLYNPLGSGVFLSLVYASLNLLVATTAAAAIWIGVNPTASAATTGTLLNGQNCNGGGGTGKVKPLTTATLPATPTILAELGAALTGAITVVTGFPGYSRWFDGAIGIGPGGCLSFQMSTAGGTSSALGNWIWEEVPFVGSAQAV